MISRQQLIYRVKRTAARLLYSLGLMQAWQAITLRRRAVVLMYHRVLTAEQRRRAGSHPALVVDADTFARQMAFLKEHFVVMSVAQFAEHLEQRRPFPPSTCIITFDDGWHDNYQNAVPVLARLGLPSLIFLPINYIGGRRVFWQEALVQLLHRAISQVREQPDSRAAIEAVLKPVGLAGVLEMNATDPKAALFSIVTEQKRLSREAIEQLVGDLARAIGVEPEELAHADGFIDWSQVEEMSRQGVTFGGHGLEHLLLTQVSDAQVDREVTGSKAALDQRLREPTPTFSYPNGYCTPKVAEKVKSVGYRLAFIATGGPVTCNDDPWTVGRVNIHESVTDTEPLFLARLVGLI